MLTKKWVPQLIVVVATLLVICSIVLTPLGVADGGALYKQLERLGLHYQSTPTADYAQTQYSAGLIERSPNMGTFETVVLWLKSRMPQRGVFETAYLAWLCGILLVLALWILMRAGHSRQYTWTNFLLAALLVLVFADYGYTLFFNSLYADGLSFSLLMLSAALLFSLHRAPCAAWWRPLVAAVAVLLFARMGIVPAAMSVVMAVVLVLFVRLPQPKVTRGVAVACGVLLLGHAFLFMSSYRDGDYQKTMHHAVFFGVSNYDSVEVLGVDPSLDVLKGQFYSEDLTKEYGLEKKLFWKVSRADILTYYATHWGSAFDMLVKGANNAFFMRPSYLGNYTEGSGKPLTIARGFSAYSIWKQTFVPNTFLFVLLFFAFSLGVLIYLYVREKAHRAVLGLGIACCVMLGVAWKLPLFLGGCVEVSRSLFLFNAVFDMIVVYGVVGGARYLLERRRLVTQKFGVTQ